MRVVFFTETFLPKTDGIVTTVCQTVKGLASLGHEVLIFAPDGGVTEYESCRVVGIRGYAFPPYPELRLSLPRASMHQAIEEFQPDVLHVAEPAMLGIAGLYYGGGRHGGALRLPLVVSYHTDLPKYLRHYGFRVMEPYIWRILRIRHNRATVNLCTSVAKLRELAEHGIERVRLWPGGVDAERFQPAKRSAAMRAKLSEGHPERPLLLYVGRLSAEKEIERLRPMLEAVPEARLALVGDGPHRKALERHFAGLPVTMPGFLHGEELAAAYASSDVFVMPSRSETLGLVVLEAMSSGVPVVGARAGGIPEMIEEGVSGYLYDDAAEAVQAIGALLSSAELRATVGAAARQQASQQSWKAATETLLEHYREACASQPIGVPEEMPAPQRGAMARGTLYTLRKLLP
jgi:glycosyltransferase involved in cell wall biosynthesis